MLKKTLVPALALSMAFMAYAGPAQAKDHTARNVLLGVAAAIGAATIIAAATGVGRKACARGRGGLNFCDRAVSRCLNAAHRDNLRRGGGGVEFLRLNRIKGKSYGVKVYMRVRAYEPWGGVRRHTVRCKVRRNLAIKDLAWLD